MQFFKEEKLMWIILRGFHILLVEAFLFSEELEMYAKQFKSTEYFDCLVHIRKRDASCRDNFRDGAWGDMKREYGTRLLPFEGFSFENS